MIASLGICTIATVILAWSPDGKIIDFKMIAQKRVAGRVLAITRDSILVHHSDGKKLTVGYPLHDRLAAGLYNRMAPDAYSYRVQDVQVGDVISMHLEIVAKQEYCVSISICVREGGKVPPSPRPKEWHPYHENANAYNAFKYDGIPIPRYLRSDARAWFYPAFDPSLPRNQRIAPWPSKEPFTYVEWVLFLR